MQMGRSLNPIGVGGRKCAEHSDKVTYEHIEAHAHPPTQHNGPPAHTHIVQMYLSIMT